MISTDPCVLVIDDNQDIRDSTTLLLQDVARVTIATNGEDAVKIANEHTYALIIVDVCLGPGIDGFETIKRIRDGRGPSACAPVIVMTAFDTPAHSATALYKLAAVDYLVKPVDPDFLIGRVAWFVNLYTHRCHWQAQNELADFLENAVTPLHCIGPDGKILWANKAELELFGYGEPEYVGHNISEFYGIDAASAFLSALHQQERVLGFEVHVTCKDGMVRVVEISSSVYWRDKIFVHTRCFTRDVTRSRQMEHALRESERRFRYLAESIPQIVWLSQANGDVIYFNQRWYYYTGLSHLESMGLASSQAIHPADRQDTLTAWQQCVKLNVPYAKEARLRRHDGVYRRHLLLSVPLRDDGDVVQWFGTGTDIEDQKLTEDRLRQSNLELEQFTYIASHDLQEPLRMIISYLQLLADRWQDALSADDKARQYMGFVTDAATRMQALIHDLLQFSRVGTRGLTMRELPLKRPYEEAIANLRAAIASTGATITCAELPTVSGDESQLVQLFQNLLANALKFRGDEPPRVHVGVASQEPGYWRISVTDNGIGIAAQHYGRIFVVFQRLHHRQQYPGTGIGLAICKRIVERHGGRIWVESEEGEGSTFYCTLPTLPAKPDDSTLNHTSQVTNGSTDDDAGANS